MTFDDNDVPDSRPVYFVRGNVNAKAANPPSNNVKLYTFSDIQQGMYCTVYDHWQHNDC